MKMMMKLVMVVMFTMRVSKVNKGKVILLKRSIIPCKHIAFVIKEDKTTNKYTSSVWTEDHHDDDDDDDNVDVDDDDNDDEMVLWMCEEHHGSSLSSAGLTTNPDVVRS